MDYLALLFNKEDTQIFQELFFNKFVTCEKIAFPLLFSSMLLAIIEENFYFQNNRFFYYIETETGSIIEARFEEGNTESWMILIRCVNVVISTVLVFLFVIRKYTYFKYLKSCFLIPLRRKFHKHKLFFEYLAEIILLMVQPYPLLDGKYRSRSVIYTSYYYYNSTLTAIFLIIRLLFLSRSLLYCSNFSSAKANKICFDNGAKSGLLFTIKTEFKYATQRFVFLFVGIFIVSLGILLRVNERSFMHLSGFDWDYLWNSFWDIIITITSVGYGDYFPVSYFGRVVIGMAAMGGGFITSLIYIIFMQVAGFNRFEEKAFNRVKATESRIELRKKAIRCVILSLNYNRNIAGLKTEGSKAEAFDNFLVDVKQNVKDFSNMKKTIVDFKYSNKVEGAIDYLREKLTFDIDYVCSYLKIIDLISKKIDQLIINTNHLEEFCANYEEIYTQTILNLNTFHQEILSFFSTTEDAKQYSIKPLKFPFSKSRNSAYLVDWLNASRKSVDSFRSSITNLSLSNLSILRKNSPALLKMKNESMLQIKKVSVFSPSQADLKNHPYYKKRFTTFEEGMKMEERAPPPLIIKNKSKQEKFDNIIKFNEKRTSILEGKRASLAFRISVLSMGSDLNDGNENNDRKMFGGRITKKELTSLLETKDKEKELSSISSGESEVSKEVRN